MSDTESVDYLQTGFDPKSLTVPRLRSILVTYNISYPATAKKQQLIDLFNENVVPQSKKILNQRARAKRSSRGIVDVESQSSASFDDHELMPPPTATRARSPRKSTRVKQESEEPEHAPELRSPRKRQVRSTSRQLAPTSDEDELPKAESAKPGRRSRTKTPQVKEEEFDDDNVLRESGEDESVFTSDNPFQSGSSPPPVKTPSNRRRTTGAESTKATASSTTRRRTDGPVTSSDKSSKYSKTYEIPLARKSPKTPEPGVVEAGEEFTPDEQLELAQQEAERGPLVRQPKPARRGSSLATPLWVLVLTLLGAYAAWYRQEKIAVGYCGVGRPAQSIIPPNIRLPAWAADSKVAEWLSEVELPPAVLATLEPQCEPCPVHATCYDDFSVKCDDDYILKAHPLSLGGLIPLPPTCEPDGEKVRRVKAVADKAVEELRDRRAKFECGELVDEEGEETNTPAINEQDLKEVISEKRSKKLDKQEFDDLWASALGDIKERDEVEVEVQQTPDSGGIPNTRLSSTSLARLPITCAIRRSLWLGFARFRLYLLLVILSTGSLFYARSRYRSHRATVAQIPALVDIVMDKLSAQKEIAYDDSTEDPFLFLPNLRDDVLRAMHSLAERERVWQRVRPVVEQNSNVRTGQREGRNGEVGRAWEWIGPTASLTAGGGEASARRRRSGRVSFGPGVKKEEEDDEDVKTPVAEMVEKSQDRSGIHRRWEEPRPIY